MNDRQLKSFVRAAELQSFAKAAKEAYITSPALINQINTLEKDIGVELFNRNTHGISLSREGQIFFRAAKQILEVYDKAVEECASLPAEDNMLRFGFGSMMAASFYDFGFDFRKRHPELNLNYAKMECKELHQALTQGKADLIYCAKPAVVDEEDMQFIPVHLSNLSIIVAPGHPLSQLERVSAEQLKKYEVLTFNVIRREVKPVSVLAAEGVECSLIDTSVNTADLLNYLMEDKVLVVSNTNFRTLLPGCPMIETPYSGGWFGFLMPRVHSSKVDTFVTDYLGEVGVSMQPAV